jgi:hypothetical protein
MRVWIKLQREPDGTRSTGKVRFRLQDFKQLLAWSIRGKQENQAREQWRNEAGTGELKNSEPV